MFLSLVRPDRILSTITMRAATPLGALTVVIVTCERMQRSAHDARPQGNVIFSLVRSRYNIISSLVAFTDLLPQLETEIITRSDQAKGSRKYCSTSVPSRLSYAKRIAESTSHRLRCNA